MKDQLKSFPVPVSLDGLKTFFFIAGVVFLSILLLSPSSRADAITEIGVQADSVLIKKSERKLYLLKDGKVFRDYQIALGKDPQGAKLFEGDNRTPEGRYCLDWRNSNSAFYKSIHISYPNEEDIAFARVK